MNFLGAVLLFKLFPDGLNILLGCTKQAQNAQQ